MPDERLSPDLRGGEPAGFVGRQDQLALVLRRWDGAAAGQGHFLLVAGEAGIGKTRLLREIAQALPDATQITTSVFSRDIEAVGGVLIDLAAELTRLGHRDRATAIRDLLTTEHAGPGDASRNRRLLVADLAAVVLELMAETRTLLFIEDLHWADELSLDVLERVAAAISHTSSMIVATYRSDELYPRTPLRRMRSRLLEQRRAEEVRLPRLNDEETTRLIEYLGGASSADTASSIVDRSSGIPLYVEELLADPSSVVPSTIADAVLGQTAALTAGTTPVLRAAAVIGRSFDIDLLARVTGESTNVIDSAVAELAERNLVVTSADRAALDFRHALIRDAIYESIPPLARRALHARVARAAEAEGFSEAYLSDQFERAHDPAAANRFALIAGSNAMRISAHREAAELFRRAQRTEPADTPEVARAALHAQLAAALEATDDNAGAAIQYAAAIELLRRNDDEVAAARLVPRLAAIDHLLGYDFDRRTALIDDELERLQRWEGDVPDDVRAGLLAASAAASMLDRRLDEALREGTLAAQHAHGSGAVAIDIDLTTGAVLTFAGRDAEGWTMMERAIAGASDAHLEATAARGYRMLGSSASVLVEYARARQWLSDGLEYTTMAERWNDHHYLDAHAAHVDWATGNWADAETRAGRALRNGGAGITTRNVALIVLGYLALGRAESSLARERLEEALQIGERMHELQRIAPPLWGLAELDQLEGAIDSAVERCERALAYSEPLADAAYLFPFLVTGVRAYLARRDLVSARSWLERASVLIALRGIPGTLPAIEHAEGLLQLAAGQTGAARTLLESARAGWSERERFWEGTRALVDLAVCAMRSRRPRDAVALLSEARVRAAGAGATALSALIEEVAVEDDQAGPLSPRELDVAKLVAAGATNREIAEQLVISPKTASSHIEHILAKLGVSRRAEIAAWVVTHQG